MAKPKNWSYRLRQWHWVSSAWVLTLLVFFSITGITLNRAAWFPATAQVVSLHLSLSPEQMQAWRLAGPAAFESWLQTQHQIALTDFDRQIEAQEWYYVRDTPGTQAWLSLDWQAQALVYESRFRGWVAYFNDVHKGRHTSAVWHWVMDISALICVLSALSGIYLLWKHRPQARQYVYWGSALPILVLIFLG